VELVQSDTQVSDILRCATKIYGISLSAYDWTSADTKGNIRSNKFDSICPVGFTVPPMQEFKDEKIGLKTTYVSI
jgi:2-keto-4-pentenoate hydratase/2-oxohepta-3-ene-1,7-dioic acid hydratase in catechol pathway